MSISPKKPANLLVVAKSARAFTESAQRGAYSAVAIDAFCDADTQRSTVGCHQLELDADGDFSGEALHALLEQCLDDYPELEAWAVGSGFENCPEVLASFAEKLPLLGNTPQVMQLCSQRSAMHELLELLKRLEIPTPPNEDGRLSVYKKPYSSGGQHISFDEASTSAVRENYLPGTAISHLFLSNGEGIQHVGLASQWQSKHDAGDGRKPFCYGGAINRCALDSAQIEQLQTWAQRLTKELGLRGLVNIDYLYSAGQLYLLEINPRLSSSFALYDAYQYDSLLDAHIQACQGVWVQAKRDAGDSGIRAHAVLYAQKDSSLEPGFEWADCVCDIPLQRRFSEGEPICTVTAQGDTITSTFSTLQSRIRRIQSHLIL